MSSGWLLKGLRAGCFRLLVQAGELMPQADEQWLVATRIYWQAASDCHWKGLRKWELAWVTLDSMRNFGAE